MPITVDQAPAIAVIGGSGLYHLENPDAAPVRIETPYAADPVTVYQEECGGLPVWFLPRHGKGHPTPPHRIAYRANIHALHQVGARRIIAVNAVGGIDPLLAPGALAVPDQLIDYTWGREHTFCDGLGSLHDHIDFTHPYCARLRRLLLESCQALDLTAADEAVYGCTQGPRLETAAEIRRLRRDGCSLVGMTGMPEAALARELSMDYASLCLVVNLAAGVGGGTISMAEVQRALDEGVENVRRVLRTALPFLSDAPAGASVSPL